MKVKELLSILLHASADAEITYNSFGCESEVKSVEVIFTDEGQKIVLRQ